MKNNVFQIMRGICIIAVVLTHIIDKNLTNPNYETSLVIQNIVNIAVTGFIFLAGYFINIDEVKTNSKHFVFRKSQRILIPYLLWSVFYLLFYQQQHDAISLIKVFLLGKAVTPLYYCVLYFLFILITPFVVKKMKNKVWNIVFYAVMPVWFVIVYFLQIKYNIAYSNWGVLPFTWFLYFYLGLKWKNLSINLNIFMIVVFIFVGYLVESVETRFLLSLTNNPNFSVTPIRFSAILYVIPTIFLFLKLKQYPLKNKLLVALGNNSFGIYLFHMAILRGVRSLIFRLCNTIQYNTIQYNT